jgi:hypothetical protein
MRKKIAHVETGLVINCAFQDNLSNPLLKIQVIAQRGLMEMDVRDG